MVVHGVCTLGNLRAIKERGFNQCATNLPLLGTGGFSAVGWGCRFISSSFLIDLLMSGTLQEIKAIVSSFSITSALNGKRR